jgi:hypothetical protein
MERTRMQQAAADAAGALETFVTPTHKRARSHISSTPLVVGETLHFSFACGGWLKYYLFGVARAISDHGLAENARFIGSSAGTGASVVSCNGDM